MNKVITTPSSVTTIDSADSYTNRGVYARDVMLPDDGRSVGTRVRWGAILAGASVALGIYFLLGILGAAVGLSISAKLDPSALTNGAIIWALVTTCVALFFGSVVASVLTTGETKTEAALYGIILWAVLMTFFVGLGAAGVNTGFNAMADLSQTARNAGIAESWEPAARQAGMTPEQIEQWRATLATSPDARRLSAENKAAMKETATRVTWYAFAGIWLSMATAALGSICGAGPTFRRHLVIVSPLLATNSR
jgi:hypothetical protein